MHALQGGSLPRWGGPQLNVSGRTPVLESEVQIRRVTETSHKEYLIDDFIFMLSRLNLSVHKPDDFVDRRVKELHHLRTWTVSVLQPAILKSVDLLLKPYGEVSLIIICRFWCIHIDWPNIETLEVVRTCEVLLHHFELPEEIARRPSLSDVNILVRIAELPDH